MFVANRGFVGFSLLTLSSIGLVFNMLTSTIYKIFRVSTCISGAVVSICLDTSSTKVSSGSVVFESMSLILSTTLIGKLNPAHCASLISYKAATSSYHSSLNLFSIGSIRAGGTFSSYATSIKKSCRDISFVTILLIGRKWLQYLMIITYFFIVIIFAI